MYDDKLKMMKKSLQTIPVILQNLLPQALCFFAGAITHKAWPHIKHWVQSHRVQQSTPITQAPLFVYPNKTGTPSVCSCDLDEAMNQHEKNMNSTEAQLHPFNIWYHCPCIAREFRALSDVVLQGYLTTTSQESQVMRSFTLGFVNDASEKTQQNRIFYSLHFLCDIGYLYFCRHMYA